MLNRIAGIFLFLIACCALAWAEAPSEYSLAVSVTGTGAGKGNVVFTVKPASGRHVNKEFPIKLTLTASEGVKLAKTKYAGADATTLSETELVMTAPYETAALDGTVEATLSFGTCEVKNGQVASCKMHKEKRKVALVSGKPAQAPAAPAAPPLK
jgi:hypothetical protein